MNFNLQKSIQVLERTPAVLKQLLPGLDDSWTFSNEGENTWSPYDVIGHLINGEKTDWFPRAMIILSDSTNKSFEPFDRFAQFRDSQGKLLQELLDEFAELRAENIIKLKALRIRHDDLQKTGMHPKFGEVTLRQLLASWVVHDLGHIGQISRVMAKQYKEDAGPWIEYLTVLQR